MIKNCRYCGAEMDVNAIKCPQCEKSVANAEILLDNQRRKHKKKVSIIIGIIVCIVLIIGIIILSVVRDNTKTGGSTYVEAIDMNIAGMIENNPNKFLNAYPEFMRDTIEQDLAYFTDGDFSAYIESLSNEIVLVYGSDAVASYEVVSKQRLDDDTIEEYLEALFEYITDYSIDDYTVEDAYQLNISFTFNGSVGTQTLNSSIAVMKFDGSWYLMNIINPINTETDSVTG